MTKLPRKLLFWPLVLISVVVCAQEQVPTPSEILKNSMQEVLRDLARKSDGTGKTVTSGWRIEFPMESLFPAFLISTATLDYEKNFGQVKADNYIGMPMASLLCYVTAPSNNCPFRLEVSSPKYIRKTAMEGTLPQAGKEYTLAPLLTYDYEAFYSVFEPLPEAVTVSLTLGSDAPQTKTQTVLIASIQDCPIYYMNPKDGKLMCLAAITLPAFVNENNPLIDSILKEAMDLKLIDSFAGYQRGNADVVNQAFAIWAVLQRRGIRYSNITTTSLTSTKLISQRVRPFEYSYGNAQANCVDGSVLFASILRKLGMETFLVLKPGHCFMGIFTSQNPKTHLIIETTRMGSYSTKDHPLDNAVSSALSGQRDYVARSEFNKACAIGEAEFQDVGKHVVNNEPGYYVIFVDKARAVGIQPLRYNKQTF